MNQGEMLVRRKLKDDFPFYAEHCLKVKHDKGGVVPFKLRPIQQDLHARLERIKAEKGYIKALIVKGRQGGVSTYVEGRFFHHVTHNFGVKAFILTNLMDSTKNLFEMTRRFHENLNPAIRPSVANNSANELSFDKLDSSFRVGTAGSKEIGRSSNIQLFHGSEFDFWPNPEQHFAGVMNAVKSRDGTEVILESTGNGKGSVMNCMWNAAVRGEVDYEPIFIPWFDDAGNRMVLPPEFESTDLEKELMKEYSLDAEQMQFRRMKIAENSLNGRNGELVFHQEFPATPDEAFVAHNEEAFIELDCIIKATYDRKVARGGGVILGVDPAREGKDHTVIYARQKNFTWLVKTWAKNRSTEITGFLIDFMGKNSAVIEVNIDRGGEGGAIYDSLCDRGYSAKVNVVAFGANAFRTDRFFNRRAEMWAGMKAWLVNDEDVSIPKIDRLTSDLNAPMYSWKEKGQLILESKDAMKTRSIKSTDHGDALALTFAFPERPETPEKLTFASQF